VQIVIPMAGKSQRFFDAGYNQPKCLIEFFGLPMIGHILNSFKNFIDVLVIVNEEDYVKFDLNTVVSGLHKTAKVVKIKQHSLGPSYSILKSSEFINLSKKIIVHYCDFSGAWDPYDTINLLNTYDGVFVSFTGFHPSRINGTKFAYGRANNEKSLLEIREKGSFTARPEDEYASSGIYGFSTGNLMLESIVEQVNLKLQINGEFYTSLTHEVMLRNNKKIAIQYMNLFYAWGTPEDLENYIYYMSICKNIIEKMGGKVHVESEG
jgi:NDP-sugar pyrophosphorylase family protein